jgi:pimeloyl-ACP methyl ester carboxylesterase
MTASPLHAVVRRHDGTRIAYDVVGDGPAILFVHGLTSSRRRWDPVTDQLAPDFTCVRVDLRGHGESSTAPDYRMPSLVGDLRAVTDDLGIGTPAVVGHSLGASIAAVFAALHPARAVVCVDQTLRWGDFAPLVQAREHQLRGQPMEAVLAIEHELGLGPYQDPEFERRVRDFPPEVVLGIWTTLLTTPPEQLTALSEALLPHITAPLLSLHGTNPPADYQPWLTRLVPTAVVEVWDGMGHFLHLVEPTQFAVRLVDLLR